MTEAVEDEKKTNDVCSCVVLENARKQGRGLRVTFHITSFADLLLSVFKPSFTNLDIPDLGLETETAGVTEYKLT